jgi:hypothetical protein
MTVPQVFGITLLAKADGGALTKQISLGPDGTIKSDGSACVMARGTARRARIGNVGELAELIDRMRSCEALALGRLREDLPETVEVMPKRMLDQADGLLDLILSRAPGPTSFIAPTRWPWHCSMSTSRECQPM